MKRYLMLIGRIIIVKMGVGKSGRVGARGHLMEMGQGEVWDVQQLEDGPGGG